MRREAVLRLEEISWNATLNVGDGPSRPIAPGAMPGERVWLYLDYGDDFPLGRVRWVIIARPEHEDFQFAPGWGGGMTHERALDMVVLEVALAKVAIEEIRRLAWRWPAQTES